MEPNKELESAKTLGIVSLVCAFLFWPAAIVCGHISLGKFKKIGVTEGKGLAKAGLIIGYIALLLTIIGVIGAIAAAGVAASAPEFQDALESLKQAQ